MYSFITYKFRIKDSTTAKKLNKMADSVNFVWNYCNETSYQAIKKYSKYLSAYDLMKLTTGSSWTTRTCSHCLAINGPQGLSGLSVREWICSKCGEIHDRDTNAAKNILRLGLQSPIKGNSAILRVEVNC